MHLTRVQELHLRWHPWTRWFRSSGCPREELSDLRCLRRVVLQGHSWHEDLGLSLNVLACIHALRSVEMCFENPLAVQHNSVLTTEVIFDRWHANTLDIIHAALYQSPIDTLSLRFDTPRHIDWVFEYPRFNLFPINDILALKQLRRLELYARRRVVSFDLAAVADRARRGDSLPPLESFTLSATCTPNSLRALAHFRALRALRVVDPGLKVRGENFFLRHGGRVQLPFLELWSQRLTRLEMLWIDSVQISAGDLRFMASMPRLRSVGLCRQWSIGSEIMPVLLSMAPRLKELTLDSNTDVCLADRAGASTASASAACPPSTLLSLVQSSLSAVELHWRCWKHTSGLIKPRLVGCACVH